MTGTSAHTRAMANLAAENDPPKEPHIMDPTATLAAVFDAIERGDADSARQALSDLAGWIDHGGFLPDVTAAAVAAGIVTP